MAETKDSGNKGKNTYIAEQQDRHGVSPAAWAVARVLDVKICMSCLRETDAIGGLRIFVLFGGVSTHYLTRFRRISSTAQGLVIEMACWIHF